MSPNVPISFVTRDLGLQTKNQITNFLSIFLQFFQAKYTKRELRKGFGYLDGGVHHFRVFDSCRVYRSSKVSGIKIFAF